MAHPLDDRSSPLTSQFLHTVFGGDDKVPPPKTPSYPQAPGRGDAMTTPWVVTTGTDRVALDLTGGADVIFTVTNNSPVNDRVVLDVVVEPPVERSWFTVEEPQRLVPPSASVPIRVRIAIPPGLAVGTHFVRALVYSANTVPEESALYSSRVAFEVKPVTPPTKPKRRIPIIIGALPLAIILGVVGYLVRTTEPPTSAVRDVTGVQTVHVRSDAVGPGQAATVTATCPAGTTVTGGGYGLPAPVGMVIDMSRPAAAGQGWQIHAVNPTAGNLDFDVDVVCGTIRDRQVVSQTATAQPGKKGIAIVFCPAGKTSVGGGWSALGLTVGTSLPGSTISNGWHVVVDNNTGDAHDITAYAVCATAPSRSVASSSGGTVEPNSRLEDSVDCPAGKVSTGGGFVFAPTSGISLYMSTRSRRGWDVRADNRADSSRALRAFAVCLSER